MKFAEINAKFTATVAEWMAKGYSINTTTMAGSQGELGKIDLTDGKEIIRVLLDEFGSPCVKIDNRYYHLEGAKLIVGRVKDNIQPNVPSTYNTVWNNRLDVISCEEFYEIGRAKRNGQKWYGTKDQAIAQQDIEWNRYLARHTEDHIELPEAAKEIVLPFVRRQPKCKSIRLSEISKVTKVLGYHTENNHFKEYARYTIGARGQSFRLH